MGNKVSRPRISSTEDTKNFKYFNIFNYVSKYYENPSLQFMKTNATFFREYEIGENNIIIFTLLIKKNYYSTSLWIFRPNDKSYNIYDIKYHSSNFNTNDIITSFIDTAQKL